MLFAITPLQRGHGRLRLPDRDSRFQASSAAHEADATHQAIFCYPGGFKRLGDEYFGVTSKPGNGQIRQYPTIVVAIPFSVMLRPRTIASELKRFRQKLSVTSVTSAFNSSCGR